MIKLTSRDTYLIDSNPPLSMRRWHVIGSGAEDISRTVHSAVVSSLDSLGGSFKTYFTNPLLFPSCSHDLEVGSFAQLGISLTKLAK